MRVWQWRKSYRQTGMNGGMTGKGWTYAGLRRRVREEGGKGWRVDTLLVCVDEGVVDAVCNGSPRWSDVKCEVVIDEWTC